MKRPERTRRVFRMAPRLFLIAALALAPAACNWGGRGRPEPIRFAPKTAAAPAPPGRFYGGPWLRAEFMWLAGGQSPARLVDSAPRLDNK